MRDLSVQAANATLSDSDRGNMNTEIQALYTNINNISARTQFNGQSLLTGALSGAQNTTTSTALAGMNLTTEGTARIASVDVTKAQASTHLHLLVGGRRPAHERHRQRRRHHAGHRPHGHHRRSTADLRLLELRASR